jgi:protein-S-isoprenylcysteine O-methyltransferase Ste14
MTPSISGAVIGILWISFWIYWLVSAAGSKRSIRTKEWWYGWVWVRVAFVILILILLKARSLRRLLLFRGASNPIVHGVGILLCVAGLALAVWARVYLGRNWGMPMSLKENPELVTTGPYRFVRHPIYAGMLLAMLGSSLVLGSLWLVVFVFFAIYSIVFAVRNEEQLLTKQFPNEYRDYRKRTKKLIPFVW